MEPTYWLDRWIQHDIGFHQETFNPYLLKYWPTLQLTEQSRVFVPLCGKTRDMIWLRDQGHDVLGIELSTLAVNAFYQENELIPDQSQNSDNRFNRFNADRIAILQGDFFDLKRSDLTDIVAVYDRASLVALPPDMRKRYVTHMLNLLPPGTHVLLIGFNYPQAEMQGPPYAVSPEEIRTLYQGKAEIKLLTQIDVLAENPRFQQRGLTRLSESIFLLTLHHSDG